MLILKVISALLSYPRAEMLEALDDMAGVVEGDESLPSRDKAGLMALIDNHRNADLMDSQQHYVETFDRGRNLSLHLFEHIHGESRDRGQAMVDLMRVYQSQGFEIAARELPDYIPLFLEYLSQRPAEEVVDLLRGALPILSLLGARLAERQSLYAALFDALASLADVAVDREALRQQAAAEGPDDTLARMDEIWEEEAVSFLDNPGACQSQSSTQPVTFKPRHARAAAPTTP